MMNTNKYQEAFNNIVVEAELMAERCGHKLEKDIKLVQELVDKETSKKPLEQGNQLSWIEKLLGVQKTYTCPHCYNSCLVKYAPNGRNINSHCYDCGGVLDWSE